MRQAPHQSAAPEALPPAADALGPETSRGKPRRRRIAVPVSVVAEPVAEVQAPGGQAQECAQPPAAGSPSAPGAPLPRFEPPLWEGPLPVPETPLPETPLPTPAPAASPEPECSPAGAGRVFGVWPQSHDQCAIEDVSNLSTAVDDGDCSKLDSEGTTGLASCKSACSSTSSSGLSSSCASGSSDAFGGDGNVASHGRLGSDAASGLFWSACPVPALRLELPGASPASPDEVGVASPAASLCLSPDSVSGSPSCVCSKLDSEGTTGLASCKSACSSTSSSGLSSSGLSSSGASGSSDAFGGDGNVASHGRLGSDAASGLFWSACPVPALRLELPGAAPASPDEVGVASPAASLCLSPDSVSGAPSCVAEAEGENLFNWSTELQQGAAETIEGAQCQGEAMRSWLSSLECIAMEDEAGLGPGALPELARPPLSTLSQNSLFLESPFQLQPTPKSARGPSPLARGRTPMTPGFELISPLFAVPQASPAPSAATAAPESPDVFGSAVSYVVVYAPSAVELSPPKACLHMSWRQVSGDLENTLPA